VQRICDNVEFSVETLDISKAFAGGPGPRGAGSLLEFASSTSSSINEFIRPFDLSRSPLLRVGLYEQEEQRHLILVDLHHIVSDGTSLVILLKEAMQFYRGEEFGAAAGAL